MNDSSALALLISLMSESKQESAVAVLERWKHELNDYEARMFAQARAAQGDMRPRYGIQLMSLVADVGPGGEPFYKLYPTERYMVLADDLPDFAKEHGVKLDELREVVEGRLLQVGPFRSYDGRGLSSKIYIDRSERHEQLEQDRREDETWAAYTERRNEALRDRKTPQEPKPVLWHSKKYKGVQDSKETNR